MLNGQIDSERAFRRFARDLSPFSTTVADHDQDLRTLIEDGSLGANELRVFLEDNEVELGELINNLVTTGEVVVKHLDGIEQLLVIYPYVVEGGYTVVVEVARHRPLRRPLRHGPHPGPARVPRGLRGHRPPLAARRQQPADEGGRPAAPSRRRRPTPAARRTSRRRGAATGWGPADFAYDPETGERARPTRPRSARLERAGSVAPRSLGEETWKWLYLQPLLTRD